MGAHPSGAPSSYPKYRWRNSSHFLESWPNHFRNSVLAGENLGTAVANWELRRYFLPTHDQEG